ncbi:MAG: pentapeptide repeat-containing protein [Isosphaeraceae bacterium]
MPTYSILHRWTRSTIAVIEAPTYARALEWANRRGMSLIDVDLERLVLRSVFLARADLRGAGLIDADMAGCYLRKADLRGADLRKTRLIHAFLGGADLRHSDLREAELSHADLRGARIVGADLRGTIITGARLAGAICDWRWSVIPAELLRQHPGTTGRGSRLLIDMAFYEDQRPWGWLKLLSRYGKHADWALVALAKSVRDGDNAPELLRCLASDASASCATDATSALHAGDTVRSEDDRTLDLAHHSPVPADVLSSPTMLWTCRRTPILDTPRTPSWP